MIFSDCKSSTNLSLLQKTGLASACRSNVSPMQLKNPKFTQDVVKALEAADFEPQRLCIEVTEGILISDPEQAHRAIESLKAAGIKIALDDFGSGFASIGTLRQFGFDRMKIDRSLVGALDHDENASAVLQATIALAKRSADSRDSRRHRDGKTGACRKALGL